MTTAWTEDEDWLLRECLGGCAAEDLAAALGRAPADVRSRAAGLGLRPPRRPWTPDELRILREGYGRVPAAELAARLGRPAGQLYQAASRHGLHTPRPRMAGERLDAIRRLSLAGLTDTAIAPRVGLCRSQVSSLRRRLGVPVAAAGLAAARRRAVASQRAALGVENFGELRALSYRRYARENGWPEDLRPREVQILNALCARGVPMSRPELAAAIGMRGDREDRPGHLALLSGNGPGGTYTATLLRRGLLVALKRALTVRGLGKGRSRDLYALGPAALDILAARAAEEARCP